MDPQQIVFLLILGSALVLLVSEWIRLDLTAMLIVIALAASDLLSPTEALSGFSSEPAILLVSMFVLSGGLNHTGLAGRLGGWIGRLSGDRVWRAVLVIMPSVALMAAFSHHLMVSALMLPVLLTLSRSHKLPAPRLLMPMALAASLGTTVTVIAAPAFLVARDQLERAGAATLGIFSIAPLGIALCLIGTLYVLVCGRWLLPQREGAKAEEDRFQLNRYFTELLVLEQSAQAGKAMTAFCKEHSERFTVVDWLRDGRSLARPWADKPLASGDLLLVHAAPDELAALDREQGLALHAVVQYGDELTEEDGRTAQRNERLVQAVIAPDSEFAGRSISEIDFLGRYGLVVVGLWRKHGFMYRELSKLELRPGDVVVMWGGQDAAQRLADHGSFLLLLPFEGRARAKPGKAWLAALIMGASVASAATELLPVSIAFLAGASTMVLSGCLSLKQAYESIEARLFVFIAGAIPLGLAMQRSGTANLFADWLSPLVAHWEVTWVLLALFAAAALLTQILSDTATTILLAPIAIGMSDPLDISAAATVISVAMGSVAAFITPIGHHGNLLVYEPGNYRFVDFVRVGTPLTVMLGIAVACIAPLLWPA